MARDEGRLSSFTFDLPEAQIAQHPARERAASRLLVLARGEAPRHRGFSDVVELFRPGDLLVRNDTRVLPARLIGARETGGRAELLLLTPESDDPVRWRAMARPGKGMPPGKRLRFGHLAAVVEAKYEDGMVSVSFDATAADFPAILAAEGRMPLPPYIKRSDREDPAVLAEDRERYQTVFARAPGAVAAPTAGLHFTPEIFDRLRARGVEVADLTLHVGAGTFLPVRVDRLDDHPMHFEWFDLPAATAAAVETARARGGRVVALGTTSARVLETVGAAGGALTAARGTTNLFIRPGHRWTVVDDLITNFHLPKSTLLVLVCALAGTDRMLAAYREAVAAGYRFFSYGDACWIERA